MFDPFSLGALAALFGKAILAGLAMGTVIVVFVAIVRWKEVITWFRDRQNLKDEDKDNIAVTLLERLKQGPEKGYKLIQGIFNKREGTIKEGIIQKTKELDEELRDAHKGHKLVVYE